MGQVERKVRHARGLYATEHALRLVSQMDVRARGVMLPSRKGRIWSYCHNRRCRFADGTLNDVVSHGDEKNGQ